MPIEKLHNIVKKKPDINTLLSFANEETSDFEKFSITKEILNAYFIHSKSIEYVDELEQFIEEGKAYYLKQQQQDKHVLIQLLLLDAHLKIFQWKFREVERNLEYCKLLNESIGSKTYLAYYYCRKAQIYSNKHLYSKAAKIHKKALKILKSIPGGKKKNKRLYLLINASIFICYCETNKIEEAFKYYFKVLKYGRKHQIYALVAHNLKYCIILSGYAKSDEYFKTAKEMLIEMAEGSNSAYVKECLAYVEVFEKTLKCEANEKIGYKSLKKILDKHEPVLLNPTRKYFKGAYLTWRINLYLHYEDYENCFDCTNQLNSLLLNGDSEYTFILLYALAVLCINDDKYLKKISEMPAYNRFGINNKIENLFKRLTNFVKKSRSEIRILAYNTVINFYKSKNANPIDSGVLIDCITALQEICTDTSSLKLKNIQTKQKAKKQIKKKDKLLGEQKKLVSFFKEFTYTAAHDLKAPLQTISAFVKIIKESYNKISKKEAQIYLDNIAKTSKTLLDFIDELISYEINSQGNNKHKELDKVNLLEVIKQVKLNLNKDIERSNCLISLLNLDAIVLARKRSVEILFQNLVSNAIKYRKKREQPIIEIAFNSEDKIFSVKDNGIGIAKEMHQKIFEPFFNIPRKNIISTGIGLATCRKIVESYRGEIWLESELGKGSTFYFTLNIT